MVVHLEVVHKASDRTQPCLTSVKLMELAGPLGHSASLKGCGNHKHSVRAYFQVWATEYEVIAYDCFNHVYDNKGREFCTHNDKLITAKKKAPTVFLSRIISTTIFSFDTLTRIGINDEKHVETQGLLKRFNYGGLQRRL